MPSFPKRDYLGYIVCEQGLKMDPLKVQAIRDMLAPLDKKRG